MKQIFTLLLMICTGIAEAQQQPDVLDIDSDSIPDTVNAERISRKHKFSVNAVLGYGTSYRSVRSKTYSELVECRNEHERSMRVPSLELNAGYNIKNWWQVTVGLKYFETGFHFSETKTLSDTLPLEFSNGCDVYGSVHPSFGYFQPAFYDPRLAGLIQGYHPSSAVQKINVQYYYLGVPVKMKFSVTIRTAHLSDFKLFVTGGLTPNYMVRQKYNQSFSNGEWEYVLQDSLGVPLNILRRGNVSSEIGFGFTVFAGKKTEISLQANWQNQILDIFNWRFYWRSDYQEKHNVYQCLLTVSYYLGKT